jgi:outer membrane immunogenic protein
MRRALLAATFLSALASQAFAADRVVPVTRVVPAPTVFDWTGAYFGIQAGGGWGRTAWEDSGASDTFTTSGSFLGGNLHYLWQTGGLVFGLDGEANYSWVEGADPQSGDATDIKWFGTVGGKLGFGADRLLLYVTGGWGFASIEGSYSGSATRTHNGWTAGGGVDYALTNRLILGVQYRHYDLGSQVYDGVGAGGHESFDVTLDTLGAKVDFKF